MTVGADLTEVRRLCEGWHDAEFIARARTLLPALADEVEHLRAEVWAGEVWRDAYTDACTEVERLRAQLSDRQETP